MKAGFWVAPEGGDTPIAMLPIGGPDLSPRRGGVTGTGALPGLATATAEETIARCPAVARLLPEIADALDRQSETGTGIHFDLSGLNPEEIALLGDVMGEGEVAATVALPDGVVAQIAESVLAGLWRVRFTDAEGRLVADYAEVSAIPEAVRRAAAMMPRVLPIGTAPDGAMNVLPVLAEIRDRVAGRRANDPAHVISLSLLPMSSEDLAFLEASLGVGRSASSRAATAPAASTRRRCATSGPCSSSTPWTPSSSTPSRSGRCPSSRPPPRRISATAPNASARSRRRISGDGDPLPLRMRRLLARLRSRRGRPVWQIPPGIAFEDLPEEWCCPNCDGARARFMRLGDDR